ncbi:hypothetical protein FDA52_01570 [Clostridium botulinum]|nr:hypothetical protein [Clostridium botulinum]
MGTRNVYYYSVNLRKTYSNENITQKLKQKFEEIFNANAKEQELSNIKSLDLQNGKVTLDIINDTEDFLFARVGKQTEYYNVICRDKSTMEYQSPIDTDNINQVLEICTYFLLDYNKGIVGFVFGKAAPTPNSLISIIADYDNETFMTITRIASPESVRALFKPGSTLKKFKYTVRTPNIEILESLKINDNLKLKMIEMEKQEIEIIIKNKNKPLFNTLEQTKEFIQDIFESKEKDNIALTGNSGSSRQKEFKFLEQDITYPIEIKDYEIIEGTKAKRRLNNKNIANNVYISLQDVYNKNYKEILMYAGMEYEE